MAVVEVQYLYHPHSLVLCRGRASKSMTVHAFTVSFLHLVVPPCHELDEFFTLSLCWSVGVDHGTTFSLSMGRDVFTPFSQHSREEGSSSTDSCSCCDGDTSSLALTVENIRWPRTASREHDGATKSGSRDDVATCNTSLQLAWSMRSAKCLNRIRLRIPMLVVKQASHDSCDLPLRAPPQPT